MNGEDVREDVESEIEPVTERWNKIISTPATLPDTGREYTALWIEKQGGKSYLLRVGSEDAVEDVLTTLPEELRKTYESIVRDKVNELLSGSGGYLPDPVVADPHEGADPVLMFNGEFTHQAEDFSINGAGIGFVFRRMYQNQVVYSGPLGTNWDHSYNLHLRVSDTELTLTSGELREQVYTLHPTLGYFVPPDGVHAIFEPLGESFVRLIPNGVRHIFKPDDSSFANFHRLDRIEDRFGNFLQFVPREDGLLGHVQVNHLDRTVQFDYDTQGRIIAITDFTGRTWRYTYDDFGDLVAVITPATDRYPEGLTTCYEYSTALTTGLLQHNLTRIIDADGQLYLENEYGDSPGQRNFNRVVRQRQGGGESTFEYEAVIPAFEHDYSDAQRPAHQTILMERNGHTIRHVYNKFGNLLYKKECIIEKGLPRKLVERYRYNRDGQLISTLTPEGVMTQHLYGREFFMRRHGITDAEEISTHDALTIQERQSFGRVLATVRRGRYYGFEELQLALGVWGDIFPDIFGGLDSDDIVVKFTYEPKYGQLLTVSDPRFTKSPNPEDEVSPKEHSRYKETLTKYAYTGPADNPASDPTRLLAEIQRPTPTLPDDAPGGTVVEKFEAYDKRGRLLRHVNPVGVVTINTYFSDTDGRKEGYRQRTVVDPDGLAITTEYEVDELGRVFAVHLPRSVGAPDGHFVTRTTYNELDQVVEVIASEPFAFTIRRFYDRNGKLEREERDAKDEMGVDLPDAPEVRTFEYDEEFNLVEETLGGSDLSTHLVTRHCYDTAGQRVLTILPRRNQIRFRYDERLLPVAQTLGAGTKDAATTRTEYDGDSRVRRTQDARGNPTISTLDPFGRVIAEEDALGHITRRTYDKASNVTVERIFERKEDGSYLLLARSEMEYDELGRAIRSGVNRFDDPLGPLPKSELEAASLDSPGPGTLLVTQTFYDPQGRVIRIIDPLGREAGSAYDNLDRVAAQTDPLGNRTENHYDPHSNLVRSDRHDLVRHPETWEVIGNRFFSTSATYDELDRMVTSTDSLGNVTQLAYDSRGNLVRSVDPLGNVVRTEFDIYNRRVAEIREQTATGLGGGDLLSSATTKSEYDDNSNVIAVIDSLERRTQYTIDALERRRAIIYPDGSKMTFDYDRDSNLILTQDNNGLRRHYTVDALGRTTRIDVDKTELNPDVEVEGATFEAYRYDGLDRQYHEENDFARCNMRFNSLSWPFEETITFTTSEAPFDMPLVIARKFSDVGTVTGLTYPNGLRLRCHRDDLDRLTRVENLTRGTDYPGHSETPDVYDIATMEYLGTQRGLCVFGNGARTSYAHDGAARLVEIAHISPTAPLLTLQYLFDAVGNMRFRNDIKPSGKIGEAFKYDSFYRLANEAAEDKDAFDTGPFTPAATLPPDPIPNRQADINERIGLLTLPTGTQTFDYDLVGNRKTGQVADGGVATYDVNDLDQYTERAETPGDSTTFKYDHNGNLKDDGMGNYVYDSLNRLVKVIAPAGEVRFFHDASGRRILELRNGEGTHLICDGSNLIAEYRAGKPFAQYVHDDGVDRPLQMAAEASEHWYHADLVGSVRLLTDRAGNGAAAYRYNPFGDLIKTSGNVPYNPLRYTARRFDADLVSYDFRARQYDPHLGRFLQRDPIGMVDGTNLYTYTGNNPLAFADPFGTDARPEQASLASTLATLPWSDASLEQLHQWYSDLPEEIAYDFAVAAGRLRGYSGVEVVAGENIHAIDRALMYWGHAQDAFGTDLPSWLTRSLTNKYYVSENFFLRGDENLDDIREAFRRRNYPRGFAQRAWHVWGTDYKPQDWREEQRAKSTIYMGPGGKQSTAEEQWLQHQRRRHKFGQALTGDPVSNVAGGLTLMITGDLNKAEFAANVGALVWTFIGGKAQAAAQAGPAGVSWEFGAASGVVGPAKSVVPVRRNVRHLPVAPTPTTTRSVGTKPGRAWITVDSAGRARVHQERVRQ